MGKSSQAKGRRGEREFAAAMRNYGFPNVSAAPPLNYGTVPDVVGLPGVHCEIKRVERLNVLQAMQQASRDAEKFQDGLPVVFHRRNKAEWLCTMRLADWLTLYRAFNRSKITM